MTTIRDIIAVMRASQDWSVDEIAVVSALEAENAAMRPVVDAAIAFVHQPGSAHYIPASLSPVCKLEEAVRKYEEVKA